MALNIDIFVFSVDFFFYLGLYFVKLFIAIDKHLMGDHICHFQTIAHKGVIIL